MKNLFTLYVLLLFSCSKGSTEAPVVPAETYILNIAASLGGSVTYERGPHQENSNVSIEAVPAAGYEFNGWTGSASGKQNPLTVRMTANKNITANFIRSNYTLSVTKIGEGTVSQEVINSAKTTDEYTSGTVVRLNATPANSWLFAGWTGSESSSSNQFDITLNENKNIFATFIEQQSERQAVLLNADGPSDTYELITSVFAPGNNPVEAPDCNHADFGRHIEEVYNEVLSKNVFKFHIHVTPDNDRCINFDRQRNEIKTYDKSPENLKGTENERVTYSWKFQLPEGFQSSPKFTHIHQIKSVGGAYSSMPMYTLTTRKGSPDELELRYAETDSQITLIDTDLTPFIGQWIEVTETILYATNGSYSIELKNALTQEVLLSYSNDSIINWRQEATFSRPKWGVYRSLIYPDDIRDEAVLFSDFSILEH
jgi:uncharacterized repeat protein (TIGR02543 family)